MSDIVLVRPRTTYGELYLPWNLMYIAAPVIRKGYSVSIIDQNTDAEWKKSLRSEISSKPMCVGTGAFTGRMIEGALEASRIAHEAGVTTVWGGVHASLLPEQTLQDPSVDYVVVGEGDATFEELVDRLSGRTSGSPGDILGLAWKDGTRITVNPPRPHLDLDSLAPTPWGLTDPVKYFHDRGPRAPRFMDFCSSRGCPYNCGFCYNVAFHKRKWRGMSAEVFFGRVKEMVERFGVRGFIFMDDYFFANMERIVRFSELLLKNNMQIVWEVQCRLDAFDQMSDEILALFVRAGLWRFHFGAESGNPGILELMDKKITLDMARRAAERARRFRVAGCFYFMLGFPGETPEEMLDTYAFMNELAKGNPYVILLGPYIYVPYPETPLYHRAVELGFVAPTTLEGWADTEGWGEFLSPHSPAPTRYFMNISKRYFRASVIWPQLKPLFKLRMALFRRMPRGSAIEWGILKAAETVLRPTLTRINLRRWANR